MSSGGELRRINVGITPYQPIPRGPDDPAYSRPEGIEGYYETPRYQEFEALLLREAAKRGLRVVEIRRVVGVWEEGFELAVSVELEGDPGRARELARSLRREYDQDSVLEFGPDPRGEDALYLLWGIYDRRRAAEVMQEHSFPGGRFDRDRLEIVDPGIEKFAAAVELARRLDADFGLRRGSVSFLEDEEG